MLCHANNHHTEEGYCHSWAAAPCDSFNNTRYAKLRYRVRESPRNVENVLGFLVGKQRAGMAMVRYTADTEGVSSLPTAIRIDPD